VLSCEIAASADDIFSRAKIGCDDRSLRGVEKPTILGAARQHRPNERNRCTDSAAPVVPGLSPSPRRAQGTLDFVRRTKLSPHR